MSLLGWAAISLRAHALIDVSLTLIRFLGVEGKLGCILTGHSEDNLCFMVLKGRVGSFRKAILYMLLAGK